MYPHTKNYWAFLRTDGDIYRWHLGIGRFEMTWEHKPEWDPEPFRGLSPEARAAADEMIESWSKGDYETD